MNVGWVTSAAAVGLLVSTVIYVWQRSLEHRYQIQKEKRELYVKLIRQSKLLFLELIEGNFDDISHLWTNEKRIEADILLSAVKVYEAAGVYFAFRELLSCYTRKAQQGFQSSLSPSEQIADLRKFEDSLDEEIRIDLAETVKPFTILRRKRFRFKPTEDLHAQLKMKPVTDQATNSASHKNRR